MKPLRENTRAEKCRLIVFGILVAALILQGLPLGLVTYPRGSSANPIEPFEKREAPKASARCCVSLDFSCLCRGDFFHVTEGGLWCDSGSTHFGSCCLYNTRQN